MTWYPIHTQVAIFQHFPRAIVSIELQCFTSNEINNITEYHPARTKPFSTTGFIKRAFNVLPRHWSSNHSRDAKWTFVVLKGIAKLHFLWSLFDIKPALAWTTYILILPCTLLRAGTQLFGSLHTNFLMEALARDCIMCIELAIQA